MTQATASAEINPNANQINASRLHKLLVSALTLPIENYITPMITGIPGVGKTEIVRSAASEANKKIKVIRPIQHETVEFTGVPIAWKAEDGTPKAAWGPLEDLLPTDPEWDGVVFFDEITQLQVNEQKVIASILDKEGVAGRRVPPKCKFILAGNRTQDRAGANRMISIIESRTFQVELLFSVEAWCDWAERNHISEVLTEFARFKAGSFVSFDPSRSMNAVPRTWCKVDQALKHMGDMADIVIQGLVGNGPAAELRGFRNHYEILHGALQRIVETGKSEDPSKMVEKSGNEKNVSALSVQHALTGACCQYARENPGMPDQHLTHLLEYATNYLDKPLAALFMHRIVINALKAGSTSGGTSLGARISSHPLWLKFLTDNKEHMAKWSSKQQ